MNNEITKKLRVKTETIKESHIISLLKNCKNSTVINSIKKTEKGIIVNYSTIVLYKGKRVLK